MLTIGELARFADVTIRTVRHYHQLGLLPEPGRDELGHRRYGADDLVALRRLTTLADAGVPLREIPAILATPAEERDVLLRDCDRRIRERERELRETRARLGVLRQDWDGSGLPGLAELLADLRALGVDERDIDREREAWEITWALYPDLAIQWLQQQRDLFTDDEYVELYRVSARLRDLSPDDPAVEELARRNVAWTVAHRGDYDAWVEAWAGDARAARLMQEHTSRLFDSPAYRRLQQRMVELLSQAGLESGEPPE